MPNFDTGHYFLTVLAPIKSGMITNDDGDKMSHEDCVRALLNILPTALQSPMTEIIGINSPFSRNLRTHFVRMMVLDNVINNGRVKVNPLWAKIKKIDMLDPQPNDVLSTPYLVMSIDFDAVMKTGDDLPATLSQAQQNEARDNYCREIWGQMEKELRSVFKHCFGFCR